MKTTLAIILLLIGLSCKAQQVTMGITVSNAPTFQLITIYVTNLPPNHVTYLWETPSFTSHWIPYAAISNPGTNAVISTNIVATYSSSFPMRLFKIEDP